MIYERIALSFLTFTEAVNTNIKGFVLEHPLVLDHSVVQNVEQQSVRSDCYLVQSVHVSTTIKRTVSDSVILIQAEQPRVDLLTAFQFLSIQQVATVERQWPLVSQTLAFVQVAAANLAKGTYDTLSLSQTVQLNVSKGFALTHTLTMQSNGRGYLPSYFFTSYPIVVVAP